MPSNPRWVRRPEGSTWGDFGPDDQLGRLNLLTPQKVREGIAEVREGRTFCLSLPLDRPGGKALNPRRGPPVLSPTGPADKPRWNQCLCHDEAGLLDVVCDDKVEIALQYSTQWDALVHVGALFDADGDGMPEPVYYNGFRAGTDVLGVRETAAAGRAFGALKLGIEHAAAHGVQGRGVLVDLFARFGETRRFVTYDDLMSVMDADGVSVEPGDILCLHTGFAGVVMRMDGAPDPAVLANACAVLDGRDERLLQWISDSQIAALATDNYAVEGLPARPFGRGAKAAMPLHHHCLFKLGLPLGELWWLGDLAAYLRASGRSRFLLTAPPLRLPGAAGSPVTPIATL
ncbi:MAG: cyclase [Rhizobiales bacterium 24-66-13]|nr:MAG: cyclase [Rhizobiales bacterium 35-66-30]OYZ77813.1 MAG: cyclase [Rhizobiales bacterium 24-66-13]OZB10022.1 MAG: cyclase [Rhizobiales bacterium 39-66-18]HQS09303.1 cyclase family protein [Xanthobacteraceae bacterium]HQS48626.1 cyclase family protein [Xanthobacteraceae bacterium]